MLQTSFDHFASQLIGVLMNGWVRHEFIFARSFGFDLLSNVVVVASKPLVRHTFDAHSQLLLPIYRGGFNSLASKPTGICVHGVYPKGNFLSPMTGAALESTLLKASFAPRDSSQSHPVFAGGTHRSFSNGT